MTNYIIPQSKEHYFYKPYDGICKREKKPVSWGDHTVIYKDGLDNFCVYRDENQFTHIICTNANHDIIYFLQKNAQYTKYTLVNGKEPIIPLSFRLTAANGRLNLFYTTEYENEILLIHCVMGANAQPSTLDTLSCNHFFIADGKVYYSNKNSVLGYQDFSDGKPDRFIPLHDNGTLPYVLISGETEYIVWKCKNKIMLGDTAVFEDLYCETPIILQNDGQLLILWKSHDFVRYITSFNGGSTWSAPMRFVNPNRNAQLYYAQFNNAFLCFYGNHSNSELNIFGKSDLFSDSEKPTPQKPVKQPAQTDQIEIQKLKIMIEMVKSELVDLKKQIVDMKHIIEKNTASIIEKDPS